MEIRDKDKVKELEEEIKMKEDANKLFVKKTTISQKVVKNEI
jgi:hypothetical protein